MRINLYAVLAAMVFVAVVMFSAAVILPGCAGTEVVQKSLEWEVNEATAKVYKSRHEVTRGRAGAAAAKLDTGALTTYVQVDEDGSYVIDMTGQAAGADAVALSGQVVELASIFSQMLPEGQLVGLVAALKMPGMTKEEAIDALTDAILNPD